MALGQWLLLKVWLLTSLNSFPPIGNNEDKSDNWRHSGPIALEPFNLLEMGGGEKGLLVVSFGLKNSHSSAPSPSPGIMELENFWIFFLGGGS